jgi:hypothetical protein
LLYSRHQEQSQFLLPLESSHQVEWIQLTSASCSGSSAVSVVNHAAGKQQGEADEQTSSSNARTVNGSTMSIFMLMASLSISPSRVIYHDL